MIMNYTKIYENLIDKRKAEVLLGGFETHHIIPKCIGGTDDESNLVRLSYREHLIAHVLLSKMHPESWGLSYAVYMMCAKAGSKSYVASKLAYIEKHRARTTALWSDPEYLSKQSFRSTEEFRQRMSIKMKQVYANDPSIVQRMIETKRCLDYSLIWTDERKRHASELTKGVKKPQGFGETMSRALKGRQFTDAHIANFRKSRVGKGTGERNSMSIEENRMKVSQSKIGRKMVCVDGVRRYLPAAEYEKIKDDIVIVAGKLYYTTPMMG